MLLVNYLDHIKGFWNEILDCVGGFQNSLEHRFFFISANLGNYRLKSIFEALRIYKIYVMFYETGKMRKLNI